MAVRQDEVNSVELTQSERMKWLPRLNAVEKEDHLCRRTSHERQQLQQTQVPHKNRFIGSTDGQSFENGPGLPLSSLVAQCPRPTLAHASNDGCPSLTATCLNSAVRLFPSRKNSQYLEGFAG